MISEKLTCVRSSSRKFARVHIIVAASSKHFPTGDRWIAGGIMSMGKHKTGRICSKKERLATKKKIQDSNVSKTVSADNKK